MYVCTYVRTYIHICMFCVGVNVLFVYMYVRAFMYKGVFFVRAFVCKYLCMHACVYVCRCACVYVGMRRVHYV